VSDWQLGRLCENQMGVMKGNICRPTRVYALAACVFFARIDEGRAQRRARSLVYSLREAIR